MILAENKIGQQLLEFIKCSEQEAVDSGIYNPITAAFTFIKCKNKYLVAYNKWRNQWEIPAGKIESDETLKECAKRELFEETNQSVSNLIFKGLFKIYDKKKDQIRYRAAYFAEINELVSFNENDEMSEIMLWDLTIDIGNFDEVDKKMLQLCLW